MAASSELPPAQPSAPPILLPYEYTSLPVGHIRLLQCRRHPHDPSHDFTFLETEISNVHHEYIAVSYTWGGPNPSFENLIVSGRNLALPSSAAAVIKYLVATSHIEIFNVWLDAVCINQSDVREKNHQVASMVAVYRSASHVFVWLGPADSTSSQAFTFMHQVHQHQSQANSSSHDAQQTTTLASLCNEANLLAFAALLARPWFRRVWVIQEVAVARSVQLACGHDSLDWAAFDAAFHAIWDMPVSSAKTQMLNESMAFFAAKSILVMRSAKQQQQQQQQEEGTNDDDKPVWALADFVDVCAPIFHSTDPRDRVFAVRDVVSGYQDAVFAPDYNVPVHTLFADVTFTLLTQAGTTMEPLLHAAAPLTKLIEGLPSWVQDLTVNSVTDVAPFGRGGTPSASSPARVQRINATEIAVHGVLVDELATVTEPQDVYSDAWTALADVARKLQPCPSAENAAADDDNNDIVWKTGLMYDSRLDRHELDLKRGWDCFEAFVGIGGAAPAAGTCGVPVEACVVQHLMPWVRETRILAPRVVASTRKGFLAVVSSRVRPGDRICILMGSRVLFAVRETAGGKFELVSPCYVQGLMDGEGLAMGEAELIHLV